MSGLLMDTATAVLGGEKRLDAVSLSLEPGELVVLLGPNGAGKTTLLRAALGLVPLESGSVSLDSRPVGTINPRERAGHVGWLPQQASIDEPLTVLELVAAARYRFNESFQQSAELGMEALKRVRADGLAGRRITELSGGERQRAALAALLAQDAPIVLLDEPANHLDPSHQIDAYRLVGELWRAGLGVLCVTHDVNLVANVGNPERVRVVGLERGRLQFDVPYSSPELPQRLSELFALELLALEAHGRRIIVPCPAQEHA